MKLLIYTANYGHFDKVQHNEEQELPEGIDQIEYVRFDETNLPLRDKTFTPRMQARLVKMFGWQLKPDFDYYLWVDSSCRLAKPDLAQWFMDCLVDNDIAVFLHPDRDTIQQEADFLKDRLKLEADRKKKPYVLSRYQNEDIDGALSAVDPEAQLYASTAFIYRNAPEVQAALKEWWYLTSRYHSIDQLGLSEAIKHLNVSVIPDKYPDKLEPTR